MMDEARGIQAKAPSVALEDLLEVTLNSVLRAVQAQKLVNREDWPWGGITVGIVMAPPEIARNSIGVRAPSE